jgi:GNAT superfamily N-acetyltransferase
MTIRPATADDARPIAQVHVASWRAAYRGLVPDEVLDRMSVDERAQRWAEWIGVKTVLVAEADDGAVTGFAAASADTGEIHALYVAPDHWRRGIGAALLAAAHQALIAAGRDQAVLWVFAENGPARAFYAAHGYAPDGARTVHVRTGAEEIRLWTALGRSRRPELQL